MPKQDKDARLNQLASATLAALYAGDEEAVATGGALVEKAEQTEQAGDDE